MRPSPPVSSFLTSSRRLGWLGKSCTFIDFDVSMSSAISEREADSLS